jgi:hypothetical protein
MLVMSVAIEREWTSVGLARLGRRLLCDEVLAALRAPCRAELRPDQMDLGRGEHFEIVASVLHPLTGSPADVTLYGTIRRNRNHDVLATLCGQVIDWSPRSFLVAPSWITRRLSGDEYKSAQSAGWPPARRAR